MARRFTDKTQRKPKVRTDAPLAPNPNHKIHPRIFRLLNDYPQLEPNFKKFMAGLKEFRTKKLKGVTNPVREFKIIQDGFNNTGELRIAMAIFNRALKEQKAGKITISTVEELLGGLEK